VRSEEPGFLFTFLDREYFESIDRYQPSRELIDLVERFAGNGWVIKPGGFWTNCAPEGHQYNVQGWKIHLSGTRSTSAELLNRVVPLVVREGVPFKFCSDHRMTWLSTIKNWSRTGAGKFITIYPRDLEEFERLIECCHQETKDLNGPYLLTDHAYKDSKVVFYRYGEHAGASYVNAHGLRVRAILSPEGERVSDQRMPYYRLPSWVSDPFGEKELPSSNDGEVWLNGRYRVTSAVRYSATGGIYSAEDSKTGEAVIIREARPRLSNHNDVGNAVMLLKKEARILQKLGHTGLAPQFVDLFEEWEHWFLVQEQLQAESLWGYTMNVTLGSPEIRSAELFEQFRETTRLLVNGLQVIHSHKIVLRDFTKSNVMVAGEGGLRFIDFELAYEMEGDEPPVVGWTAGYASPEQMENKVPTPDEDYYALGALLLDMINVTASGLPLNREGVLAGLRQTLEDFGLPPVFVDIVSGMTDSDPATRWRPERAMLALDSVEPPPPDRLIDIPPGDTPPARPAPSDSTKADIEATIDGITTYIVSKIDYTRSDRLWPASGEVFATNPVSIQYGAAGTAYYLWHVAGSVPDGVVDWIIRRANPDLCPPGLYIGLSGVALLLLEMGLLARAKEVLAASHQWDRIVELPGLYEGAAGWGLVNLHFWRTTGEQVYLENALEVGEHLMRTAESDSQGVYWESDNQIPVGFGFGPSGISTFFVYLNAAHPRGQFLDIAEKALDFEVALSDSAGGRLRLTTHKDAPASNPVSPSMRHGSAGIGSAAVRLYALTGEPKFRRLADLCAVACCTRYTNKLWQDYGPAGWAEVLLDMYWFLGDENYLNNAYHVAGHIVPHRMYKPEGIAFAGSDLLRISCDFGKGSAGIGYFFHRLLNPKLPRLLLLDEMLGAVVDGAKGIGARSASAFALTT
jgi:serine/threonine protein kinase